VADLQNRIEQQLVAAAHRRTRLRYARLPLPRPTTLAGSAAATAIALALVSGAAVIQRHSDGPTSDERPAVSAPAADSFAAQLAALGVLRERTAGDDDPQVAKTVKGFGPEARADYARLLDKAPSGSAFVLVPVKHYRQTTLTNGRLITRTVNNATCLMRRGTQGGAGDCKTTAQLRAHGITGALAGQYYGLVPDGVAAIRLVRNGAPIPVERNFWVTPDPGRGVQIRIEWLDEQGRVLHRP
jgi:hypothetical protein